MSEERLVDAEWVAEYLGVPKTWVRDATREGRFPCVPVGRYRRYDPADVREWVERQKSRGAGPP